MKIKSLIFISTLIFWVSTKTYSQLEVIRNNSIYKSYKLEVFKINDNNEFSNFSNVFPLFIIDTINKNKIVTLFNQIDLKSELIDSLQNLNNRYIKIESQYQKILDGQDKRLELYIKSYDELFDQAQKLSSQYDLLHKFSLEERKSKVINSTIFGILGGIVAGLTIGIIIN